jgi:hypothetical protein
MLLQAFYSVRWERQLIERLEYKGRRAEQPANQMTAVERVSLND